MKFWIQAKYDQLLQLLGLRLTDEWLLLKAIEKEFGTENAELCLAVSVLLEIKFGKKHNAETIKKIRKDTEGKK